MRVRLDDKLEERSILDIHAHASSALERGVLLDREEALGVRRAGQVLQGKYGLNLKRFHFQRTP